VEPAAGLRRRLRRLGHLRGTRRPDPCVGPSPPRIAAHRPRGRRHRRLPHLTRTIIPGLRLTTTLA
jgi:hypothetical protein